jgi:hypothetical protein
MKHPLETAFNLAPEQDAVDIEQEYEVAEYSDQLPAKVEPPAELPPDPKDADDVLVEQRIDEVYDAAMSAFNNQTAFIEVIDPKFAARNAEVAANYLNIALQAATNRAKVKTDRKKANQQFVPYTNNKITNNTVICTREEVLRMINVDGINKKLT